MGASLFKRSLALLSIAALAAAIVFAAVGLSVLGKAYAEASATSLERAVSALAADFDPSVLGDRAAAAAFARRVSSSGYRVTLILGDGRVVADSEADPSMMENHATRPEVAAALAGGVASSLRASVTIGDELLYAAAPIREAAVGAAAGAAAGAVRGVLRLALHEPGLKAALAPARWTFGLAALTFAMAALGAAALFSRSMARPLAILARAARSYGSGEGGALAAASRSIRPGDPEELRLLASTLEAMAAEIGERISAAEAQGERLEAILDAMSEAVLALDSDCRVTIANPSALGLFGIRAEGSRPARPSLLEATHSSDLQALAVDCLDSGAERRAELALYQSSERFFQAFAAPLFESVPSTGKRPVGLVIVLGDITELRRLERVRRDFVANVSHELRTPVQLVKGFAETLREGALNDPEQALRFVSIIERNASRMESLIGDLLSLASLEREGRDWLKLESIPVRPIIDAAREAIAPKAEAKRIALLVECPEELEARVDAGLVEQALVNLVDNAVKYSPPETVVSVSASREDGSLLIEVRDQGIGIPARDLPRVFERFYRVDKARSRELGGTGLGLAIVRHIAMAHGGEASVESWEGEGSTFRIRLPIN
jgi:two-component system phosphate regulon sensor histidine kinase PhoR